mgnify:CR=1 FL=1|tara:strand:+ start:277 stop:1800 length:1524 start_codon:yes stop_codon:yes gene_type:complete
MVKDKKDIKMLFVKPAIRPKHFTKVLPVGMASVMTYFEKNGYNFTLLDIDVNNLDDADVEKYMKENKFDFVLTGTIVTHYKWMKWFVSLTKKYQPNSTIIVGNSVASSIPELFLQKTKGDIAVIGEGEISAYEAVEAVRLGKNLSTVQGIAFRNESGDPVINEPRKAANINDLPIINWDHFDIDRYIVQPVNHADHDVAPEDMRTMPVITARGCAFKCSFCHYVFWNDPYRNRTPKSVIDEIGQLVEKYDARYINFWDDLSFATAVQMEKFCDKIIESGLKIKWMASVRVDLFSRSNMSYEESLKVAKKMRKAGCYSCGFALESGNQEILEMMNKKIEADAFYYTVKVLRDSGIICQTTVLFGYPIETKETIKETFDQCLKAGIYPSIGFLMPLPSTGMYDYAKQNGFITDEDRYLESITERQDININMTKMTNDEIMNEIKLGAARLNEKLNIGLTEDTLIRSKGYKNRLKNKNRPPLDPDNLERNENDVSFNYANQEFVMEEQPE